MQQTVVMCDPEVSQRTTTVRIQFAKSSHDEFMMSRLVQPTVMMTRTSAPTGASQTSVLAGCDTRTLRVWCPRAAVPGSTKNKGRGDSTGSADRSIKQCGIGREVPADHEAQGQKCSDDCRSEESEVADVRRTTAKRRLES